MNDERLLGARVATLLDEATDRLPFRITHRLDLACEAALARLPDAPVARTVIVPALAGRAPSVQQAPSRLWRALAVTLPPLVLAAGLYGIVVWTDAQDVQETADVDAAVLVDDVPLAAYADRGFGVYLNNNKRQ